MSTGLGQTHPDPSQDITLPDGVVIPKGKGVDSRVTHSSLLYNEYPYNLGHHQKTLNVQRCMYVTGFVKRV